VLAHDRLRAKEFMLADLVERRAGVLQNVELVGVTERSNAATKERLKSGQR
jgi:hypothetical protein